jgi:hypothetical protein
MVYNAQNYWGFGLRPSSGIVLGSRRPGFAYGQHVGFVVDKAALGQFFPSTSVSPANHSTDFSIIIITRGWHNRPLSGRSVEWTLLPPPIIQIKKNYARF